LLNRPRPPKRLSAGIAAAAGVGLVMFELGRLRQGDAEAYFWLFVGGLMVLLGLIGLFERAGDGPRP
jgi:hypothetical protein